MATLTWGGIPFIQRCFHSQVSNVSAEKGSVHGSVEHKVGQIPAINDQVATFVNTFDHLVLDGEVGVEATYPVANAQKIAFIST